MDPASYAKDLIKVQGYEKALYIAQDCYQKSKDNLSEPVPFYDEQYTTFSDGEFKTRINYVKARNRVAKTMAFWANVIANIKTKTTSN